jgi:Contractile injection system tape measure protein
MNKKNIFFNNNKKIINKIFFELQFGKQKENFLLPEIAKENFYNYVLPVIEKVFNTVPNNINIQIEKLEVNIGKVKTMDELKSLLELALQRKIFEEISMQEKKLVQQNIQKIEKFSAEKIPQRKEINNYFSLIYFLKTGMLLWYENEQGITEIIQQIISELTSKKTKINIPLTQKNDFLLFLEQLSDAIFDETFRKRLIYTFEKPVIIQLLAILKPNSIDKKALHFINFVLDVLNKKHATTHLYTTLMNIFVGINLQISNSVVLNLQTLLKHENFFNSIVFFMQNIATLSEKEYIKAILIEEKIKNIKRLFETKKIIQKNESEQVEALVKTEVNSEAEIEQQMAEGIYISNAGLILLSPFLPFLFAELGLLSEGKFNSLPDAIKATQILHYIIYGSSKTPEYLLAFNKILCGLPLNTPIPQKITITKKIKTECQSMLDQVIERWSALKNTTVHGFVQSFLHRNAVLTKNNNDWLLKVETKAFDVLLDTLPWSVNFIKLKWNDYLINTEWER